MLIHEMTEEECSDVLEQARVGRLACARDNQPYVVPIFFAYHGGHIYGKHLSGKHLYGFTTLGQKIEWMRANPLVCVETDEVTSFDRWMSVVVLGRYEELPDTPEFEAARVTAYELLQRHAMWWQPGYVSTVHRDPARPLIPVYYRIRIERVTGHRAAPEEDGGPGFGCPGPGDEGARSSARPPAPGARQALDRLACRLVRGAPRRP